MDGCKLTCRIICDVWSPCIGKPRPAKLIMFELPSGKRCISVLKGSFSRGIEGEKVCVVVAHPPLLCDTSCYLACVFLFYP